MHAAAPAGWLDAGHAVLADADKPSGLVRFVFLPDMKRLVDAAGASHAVQ
jgi:hypothetical protein